MIKHRVLWVLLSQTVVFLMLVLILIWGLIHNWQNRTNTVFDHLTKEDVQITKDIDTYLRDLNQRFSGDACSPAMLKSMRIAEYYSTHFHEYGYSPDNLLLCTSGAGVLDKPRVQPFYDVKALRSDVEFTRSARVTLLDGYAEAMKIKVGSFQALLRPAYVKSDIARLSDIGIFVNTDNGFVHVWGFDKVTPHHAVPSPELLSRIAQWRWIDERCYNPHTCGVVSIDIVNYLKQAREISIIVVAIVLLVTALSGVVAWNFHVRYNSLNQQVKRGLNIHRVECCYQPILNLSSNKFESCEVLCRWRNENGDLVSPYDFIPEIEKNHQTRQLTRIVLEKAVTELNNVKLLGKIHFAINVFPDDISSNYIDELISNTLPSELHHLLTIEVTEKKVSDMTSMAQGIFRLRQKSVEIAIDDFGTGFSNIQMLKDLHVDYLKIDKSFVMGMENRVIRGSLVNHIIEIAHSLNIKTISEGVEKTEQFIRLKGLGVNYSQGYLHSKPIPIEHFARFINESSVYKYDFNKQQKHSVKI